MENNKIVYEQWVFADDAIKNANIHLATALASEVLEANTFSATVECNDPNIINFQYGAPIKYYFKEENVGLFFVQNIKRSGPTSYTFSAISSVGLLINSTHKGDIYTGQTAQTVIQSICGSVPVMVNERLASTPIYGYLPYAIPPKRSARDNLEVVLFVLGASLGTDLNGVLRVQPLWDGVSSTVGPNRIYQGSSVEYAGKISAVVVTEHQYVPGNEVKELFSGTTQQGDLITFDEPMHSLSASGFSILESGANFARLSAGTGTLTGKPYLHTTRQIQETVFADAAENVQSVSDATLVTLYNSTAVAKRLADYYKSLETIQAGITARAEQPGYVVQIYHPYEHAYVTACIAASDDTMSKTMRSDLSALVGFRPPQPEDAEYFDERVVLTGEGTFTFPSDAEDAEAVLIQAGQGGKCGHKGEDGKKVSLSWTETGLGGIQTSYTGYGFGAISKGGEAGEPGAGGKILRIRLNLTAGRTFAYKCGTGGSGAPYDPDAPDTAGAQGGETTLGTYSSASGTVSPDGYVDPITGERFAGNGDAGIAGGDSAGPPEGAAVGSKEWASPLPAGSVKGPSGQIWPGGASNILESGLLAAVSETATFDGNLQNGFITAIASGALGSGAAVGAAGQPGTAIGTATASRIVNTRITGSAIGVNGLPGANASAPGKPAQYGKGGSGGNGGGAGSGPGYAATGQGGDPIGTITPSVTSGDPGPGGAASPGGPGADGCIVLFYKRPASGQANGPLVTSDQKWLLDSLGRRLIV